MVFRNSAGMHNYRMCLPIKLWVEYLILRWTWFFRYIYKKIYCRSSENSLHLIWDYSWKGQSTGGVGGELALPVPARISGGCTSPYGQPATCDTGLRKNPMLGFIETHKADATNWREGKGRGGGYLVRGFWGVRKLSDVWIIDDRDVFKHTIYLPHIDRSHFYTKQILFNLWNFSFRSVII